MDEQKNQKVYSPDIKPYSLEGKGGLLNTISYTIVSPIRLVSRVMHNIFVMPANIQDEFAEGLIVVAIATGVLGLVDLIVFKKWMLLATQIPLIPYAYKKRKDALSSKEVVKKKPVVDIDKARVTELAQSVYDDLEKL